MTARPSLADLRALDNAATSAPWAVVNWVDNTTDGEPRIVGNHGTLFVAEAYRMDNPNAALIAAMRNEFPALLDEVEALRKVRDDVLALHRRRKQAFIVGACASEECDHEDECPTEPGTVCGYCWDLAEHGNPYAFEHPNYAPEGLMWPCDTVRAITSHVDLTNGAER